MIYREATGNVYTSPEHKPLLWWIFQEVSESTAFMWHLTDSIHIMFVYSEMKENYYTSP